MQKMSGLKKRRCPRRVLIVKINIKCIRKNTKRKNLINIDNNFYLNFCINFGKKYNTLVYYYVLNNMLLKIVLY